MSRAIVFIFSSDKELSINAIAACAKAIALDTGTSIENMIAKQFDEEDMAKSMVNGIRVGEAEIPMSSTKRAVVSTAITYIGTHYADTLRGSNKNLQAFVTSISIDAATCKLTQGNNTLLRCLDAIKDIPYEDTPIEICKSLGITPTVYQCIQTVASHV